MKIAMVNGSPKAKDSASGEILSMLKKYLCGEVAELRLNRMQVEKQDMEELFTCDVIVIAFPLYIDSVPSHLLRCLMQIEAYAKAHRQERKIRVYVAVNNGFFQGKQNLPAIEVMKHWSDRCGFTFGRALGVGGGGMICFLRAVPEGHGPKKNLSAALKEMAVDMEQEKLNGDNQIKTFEMNYPAWAYKWQAEYGWRRSAKKNGLKRKDLDKQW